MDSLADPRRPFFVFRHRQRRQPPNARARRRVLRFARIRVCIRRTTLSGRTLCRLRRTEQTERRPRLSARHCPLQPPRPRPDHCRRSDTVRTRGGLDARHSSDGASVRERPHHLLEAAGAVAAAIVRVRPESRNGNPFGNRSGCGIPRPLSRRGMDRARLRSSRISAAHRPDAAADRVAAVTPPDSRVRQYGSEPIIEFLAARQEDVISKPVASVFGAKWDGSGMYSTPPSPSTTVVVIDRGQPWVRSVVEDLGARGFVNVGVFGRIAIFRSRPTSHDRAAAPPGKGIARTRDPRPPDRAT